jgi:nucleoid-associated protein YgaU
MTRENKLALVVGFALILFVAILVSDHFSDAQTSQAAILTASELLPASHWNEEDLIPVGEPPSLDPSASAVVDSTPAANAPAGQDGLSPEPGGEPAMGVNGALAQVTMPDLQNMPAEPAATESAASDPEVRPIPPGFVLEKAAAAAQVREPMYPVHHVEPGESLTSICRRYYDDGALVAALASFNQVKDPDTVRAGHRLRIPPAAVLTDDAGSPPAVGLKPRAGKANGATFTMHVVQKGESLAAVARRYLGSPAKWGEIARLNRDVIDDPDRLEVGTKLKVPVRQPG